MVKYENIKICKWDIVEECYAMKGKECKRPLMDQTGLAKLEINMNESQCQSLS